MLSVASNPGLPTLWAAHIITHCCLVCTTSSPVFPICLLQGQGPGQAVLSVAFDSDLPTLWAAHTITHCCLACVALSPAFPMHLLQGQGQGQAVLSVAWNNNNKQLASGCMDHTAKIWDVASGQSASSLQVCGEGLEAEVAGREVEGGGGAACQDLARHMWAEHFVTAEVCRRLIGWEPPRQGL